MLKTTEVWEEVAQPRAEVSWVEETKSRWAPGQSSQIAVPVDLRNVAWACRWGARGPVAGGGWGPVAGGGCGGVHTPSWDFREGRSPARRDLAILASFPRDRVRSAWVVEVSQETLESGGSVASR